MAADNDMENSSENQDVEEVPKRVHGPKNTGFICSILCLACVFCIGAFTMFMCQLYQNFGGSYMDTDIRMRPPISHHQMSPNRNSVHDPFSEKKRRWPLPPSHTQAAKVARYIVHTSDWASIATHSAAMTTRGFPFVDILSLSDGPIQTSSGVPYMYLTPNDLKSKDITQDSRASITMSNVLSEYCHGRNFDPLSPLCARILISGTVAKVGKGTDDEKFAMDAVFSRHPEMKEWPSNYGWFFAKMNITHIFVLDFFGGVSEVNIDEYFKADPF